MDFATAQARLRDPSARFAELVEAAMVVVHDPRATLDDLFSCLKVEGLPGELADVALRDRIESFPAPIEDEDHGDDRRKVSRRRGPFPLRMTRSGDGRQVTCRVRNISAEGMCIELPGPFDMRHGDQVLLDVVALAGVELPERKSHHILAKIVWVKPVQQASIDFLKVGVAFVPTTQTPFVLNAFQATMYGSSHR
jgi:PilZ domain